MARKRKAAQPASRDKPAAGAVRWLLLALVGMIVGLMLGNLATGGWRPGILSDPTPFSSLSANPDAAATPKDAADPCLNCPDSYGVAAKMRANREQRMTDAFRDLGSVESDPHPPPGGTEDYRYGGRFTDPELANTVADAENQQPSAEGRYDDPDVEIPPSNGGD